MSKQVPVSKNATPTLNVPDRSELESGVSCWKRMKSRSVDEGNRAKFQDVLGVPEEPRRAAVGNLINAKTKGAEPVYCSDEPRPLGAVALTSGYSSSFCLGF